MPRSLALASQRTWREWRNAALRPDDGREPLRAWADRNRVLNAKFEYFCRLNVEVLARGGWPKPRGLLRRAWDAVTGIFRRRRVLAHA